MSLTNRYFTDGQFVGGIRDCTPFWVQILAQKYGAIDLVLAIAAAPFSDSGSALSEKAPEDQFVAVQRKLEEYTLGRVE